MKRCLFIVGAVILIFIINGCSNAKYPPIKEQGQLAITVNIKDMSVTFVDIESGKKLHDWKMEKPYLGGIVLPDGDRLLLYGKQMSTVDLYSLSKGEKIASWETGEGIVNGTLLENGEGLAFADQSLDVVRFFSLDGEERKKVKTEGNPLTLLEDTQENRLYAISYRSNTMTIIDSEKKEKMTSFNIHSSATGAILREKENEIWIGGHGEGNEIETEIHVYDNASGELIKTIPAPVMPINFAQRDEYLYALSHGSNTLYKFDKTGNILKSAKVGANPFEIKVNGDFVIVAGYDSDDIHFIDYETLEIVRSISVGKGPFQLVIRESTKDERH